MLTIKLMFEVCDCRSALMASSAWAKEMKSAVVALIEICYKVIP